MTEIELNLEMVAANKDGLLFLLTEQARRFYGDEPFELAAPIQVDVEENFSLDGKAISRAWRGIAIFRNTLP